MDIFGIGPLEIVFILLIALIVMGPNDMAKAGRTIGRTLRMIVTSQTWQVIRLFMKEMSSMPNRLMRESQFDEVVKEVSQDIKQPIAEIKAAAQETNSSLSFSAWANPDSAKTQSDEDMTDKEIEERTISPGVPLEGNNSNLAEEPAAEDADLNHA